MGPIVAIPEEAIWAILRAKKCERLLVTNMAWVFWSKAAMLIREANPELWPIAEA